MSQKIRLDLHLLTNRLVDSRQQAQQLIRAGRVRDLIGKVLDKPGVQVPIDLEVQIKEEARFVSRGGEKLSAAIEEFKIKVDGRVCIDCGISTGGFTDCLLQNGASLVYGIDVGYGQTAWTLRNDPKVILKERTNVRYLKAIDLYRDNDPLPDLAVADMSFISLRLVLPAIKALLHQENKESLVLVKPQFEVGKGKVGKGGVVRDSQDHVDVLSQIIDFSINDGWKVKGVMPSPITGAAGNKEYLLWLSMKGSSEILDLHKLVKENFA